MKFNIRIIWQVALLMVLVLVVTISCTNMQESTAKATNDQQVITGAPDEKSEQSKALIDFASYTIYSAGESDSIGGKEIKGYQQYNYILSDSGQTYTEKEFKDTYRKIVILGKEYEGQYRFTGSRNNLMTREYGIYTNEYSLSYSFYSDDVMSSFLYTDHVKDEMYIDAEKISETIAIQKARAVFEELYGDSGEFEVYCETVNWHDYYYVIFTKKIGSYVSRPFAEICISYFDPNYIRRVAFTDFYRYLTDDLDINFDQDAFEAEVRETLSVNSSITSVNGFEYQLTVVDKMIVLQCDVDITYANNAPHEKYSLYVIPSVGKTGDE